MKFRNSDKLCFDSLLNYAQCLWFQFERKRWPSSWSGLIPTICTLHFISSHLLWGLLSMNYLNHSFSHSASISETLYTVCCWVWRWRDEKTNRVGWILPFSVRRLSPFQSIFCLSAPLDACCPYNTAKLFHPESRGWGSPLWTPVSALQLLFHDTMFLCFSQLRLHLLGGFITFYLPFNPKVQSLASFLLSLYRTPRHLIHAFSLAFLSTPDPYFQPSKGSHLQRHQNWDL